MNRILIIFVFLLSSAFANAQNYTQQEVIYGHRDGMALTMFATTPVSVNIHRAILFIASGGYYSEYKWVPEYTIKAQPFLDRGYTVFIVLHASVPMYSAEETIRDIQRAVQFVRSGAAGFGVDADKIGITGSSSGGNLSLLAGTTDARESDSNDPIRLESSRVQAVACFFPPTDFLNYRGIGNYVLEDAPTQKMVREGWIISAFMFKELDKSVNVYRQVPDEQKMPFYRRLSPIYNIDKSSAPTLIIHGDRDVLVPIFQSEQFVERLQQQGIAAKLIVKPGKGHGWEPDTTDTAAFADWFDIYLK